VVLALFLFVSGHMIGRPPSGFITVLMVDVVLAPWILLARRRVNPGGSHSRDGLLLLVFLLLPLLLNALIEGLDPRLFSMWPGCLPPTPGQGDRCADN